MRRLRRTLRYARRVVLWLLPARVVRIAEERFSDDFELDGQSVTMVVEDGIPVEVVTDRASQAFRDESGIRSKLLRIGLPKRSVTKRTLQAKREFSPLYSYDEEE